jgi:hypothetical protein
MKKILLTLLIFFNAVTLYAQKENITTVKSVRGEFSVVLAISDITGREAAERARENAKRQALEKVCGSHVNIWDQMETSSAGDAFNSLAINQIDGEIVEFNIKEEGQMQSEARTSETIFYCIADVKVKKGLSADPDFIVDVNGLKSVYFAGDILKFIVNPHRDCYMKLFLFEDSNTGYMLYPNLHDKARVFSAGTSIDITNSPYYEFELYKSSETKTEVNRLVFVFTKSERPFNSQITSRAEIEKWIASIPNNQKYVHFAVIEIRDN